MLHERYIYSDILNYMNDPLIASTDLLSASMLMDYILQIKLTAAMKEFHIV